MDNVEARLRDLAREADETLATEPIAPRRDVVRRGRFRRAGMITGSAALVTILAIGGYAGAGAFGRGSSRPATSNVLTVAAETTLLEDTARVAVVMEMEYDMLGAPKEMRVESVGELSFVDGASHSVMKMRGDGEPMMDVEVIQSGNTVYTKGYNPDVDGWTKEELSSTGPTTFATGDQMRPEALLSFLEGISGDIQIVGHEEIDGEKVTHYSAEIDTEALLDSLDDSQKATFTAYETDFEPAEAWVDSQGRVRKMEFATHMSADGKEGSFDMTMSYSMSFFDFGTPVDIDIPDESEIVEETEFDGDTYESDMDGEGVISESLDVKLKDVDSGSIDVRSSIGLVGAGGTEEPSFFLMEKTKRAQASACFTNLPRWVSKVSLLPEGSSSPLLEANTGDLGDIEPQDLRLMCIHHGLDRLKGIERFGTDLVIHIESDSRTLDIPVERVIKI